ncbi:CHAT domain-containing protein [Nonomuraea sp. NPDC050328]|uniref:CHAT domain-containing protein n=1 Tax=Nonomuraea sp. NPDC050328 TaxID=3364361 RepID=UPI0037993B42
MITGSAVELLPLVFARPQEALARARELLGSAPGPHDASVAHQVIGIWERDFGDLRAGLGHLNRARRLARESGSAEREADVLATLGLGYVHAGRTGASIQALTRACELATGATLPRVLFRRAYVMWVLGRHQEGLEDLRRAIPLLRRGEDTIWLARALTLRGTLYLALGSVERARADFDGAEALWDTTGQEHDKAIAVVNRGVAAFRSGDLPAALHHLEQAERTLAELGTPSYVVDLWRCDVLLTAGLARDALREADAGAERMDRLGGPASRRAELVLTAARAALAFGDHATAIDRAEAAARAFTAQRRPWWAAHARLTLATARHATPRPEAPTTPTTAPHAEAPPSPTTTGHLEAPASREATVHSEEPGSPEPAPHPQEPASREPVRHPRPDDPAALAQEAAAVAARLQELGSPDAPRAWLLAGRTAAAAGRTGEAGAHLARAARARHRGPAYARVDGWLAQALLAGMAGREAGVLAACRRGLDLLDEHRMTLGAAELRAGVGAQGAELATLAQRVVGDHPRRLLAWSERWRASALSVPPARPPEDPLLMRDLTAFREISGRVEEARSAGKAVPQLQREQHRLERAIRDRLLALGAEGGRAARPGPGGLAREVLRELGPRRLAEIVVIDGRLRVLLCGGGRVRAYPAGTLTGAAAEAAHANAALRRLAYGAPAAGLERAARRLEAELLGEAAAHLGSAPLVLVPPGHLHDVPWALLPSLRERVLSVSPSAAAWLRAARIPPPDGPVVLVRGPGLGGGGAEVPVLAGRYGAATVLENGQATAQEVLKRIDGSSLAHIAAHGSFRADSPMFSSLHLDDGPLTVHDVERLSRAPYRIILSSCDSGRMEPVGGEELLGLSAALLPLGTAGIVASTVPVHDEAVVPLMLALHDGLRAGLGTAEALRDARAALPDDPLHRATGLSFSAIGAA